MDMIVRITAKKPKQKNRARLFVAKAMKSLRGRALNTAGGEFYMDGQDSQDNGKKTKTKNIGLASSSLKL
jgi:hypothetical protein